MVLLAEVWLPRLTLCSAQRERAQAGETKQRIFKVLETAVKVYEGRKEKIPTSKLNKVMLPIIESNPPPALKGIRQFRLRAEWQEHGGWIRGRDREAIRC